MDLKQLEIVSALAEHLHFSKAAKASFMTAPAVTRSIQRLENELGYALFVRSNRQVTLTSAGSRFLLFAQQTLSEYKQMQSELRMQSEQVQGELRVFGSVTASYSVLSSLLPLFRERYPQVDIKLLTGDQAQSIQEVQAGNVDLAIAARPDVLPKSLAFKALSYSPLKFIMPVSGDLVQSVLSMQQRGFVDPSLLPMIMPEKGLTRMRMDQWFTQQKKKAQVYATVSGHEAIVSMVALGLGIGLVPEVVIEHSPMREKIRLIDFAPELAPFQIGLCAVQRQLSLPQLKAFWDNAGEFK